MVPNTISNAKVFISYSHKDQKYLDRLHVHLAPYERSSEVEVWDDTKIMPGSDWKKEVEQALKKADVAILLVSADFIASKFITENELPPLLVAAQAGGTTILSIILSPCTFEYTKLARYQAVNNPSKPLSSMSRGEREEVWVKVARYVRHALDKRESEPFRNLSKSEQYLSTSTNDTSVMQPREDLQNLAEQFNKAMVQLYKDTQKAIGYNATLFYRMVNENGGVETARSLVASDKITDGFTKLWEKGRLDLTAEALVLKPQFSPLFDEALRKKARKRLADFKYVAPWDKP